MEQEIDITADQEKLIVEDRARDARVHAVLKDMFAILNDTENLKIGITPEGKTDEEWKTESAAQYKDLSFKVVKSMIDNGVTLGEMGFLFKMATGIVAMIQGNVNEIVNTKYDTIQARVFGVEIPQDITVAMVEQKLIETKPE